MNVVRFSIIIPTYQRPRLLRGCLEALAKLDYPGDRFEVLVVDDGGGVSLEFVSDFRDRLDVKLIRGKHGGTASARNLGLSRAMGDFVAFTDDDCLPEPGWLRALSDRFCQTPRDAVGGQTKNGLPGNPYSAASQAINDYLYSYYNRIAGRSRFFSGNNMAFPTERLRSFGGFSESFSLGAGEDRDVCERWQAQGLGMSYEPGAVIFHVHQLSLRRYWRQHFTYGRAAWWFHHSRRRQEGRLHRQEPLRFYAGLLKYGIVDVSGARRLSMPPLFVLSQMAIASGYWVERLRRRSLKRAPL